MTSDNGQDVEQFLNHVQAMVGYRRSFILAGMTGSKNLIDNNLQRAAAAFGEYYNSPQSGDDQLKLEAMAKEVEGCILAGQTIAAYAPAEAEKLIDELYTIVEKR